MNQKLNNTCIKCESVEHGAEIVKFYKDNGYNTRDIEGTNTNLFYGVFNDTFDCNLMTRNAKVLTLQEAKDLVKENQYPKVMWVSSYKDFSDKEKRVVIGKKQNIYVAWVNAETIDAAENEIHTIGWNYAKDIEEEPEFQTKTRERIAAIEKELEELKKLVK